MLFLPIFCWAQNANVFIKILDVKGQQINGDAMVKGYERNITVISFASAGKNNSQLTFNMNVTGVSADLKRAMSAGSLLVNGVLTVT